jgi:mRNA interferase MazF
VKDFDKWNLNKQKINHNEDRPPFFNEGDIWHVSCGVNVGTEIDGKGDLFLRPFLVLKKNDRKSAICIPCTSNRKDRDYYLELDIAGKVSNLVMSQIRVIDSMRFYKKFGQISESKFKEVLEKVCDYINSRPAKMAGRGHG